MSPVILKPLLSLLSPAGPRARLSILIYHRVLPERDPMLPGDPCAETFSWQMHLLARNFNPLPLDEAIKRLKQGTLPARAVCVTFDDGYADNFTTALPILKEAGVPATFFVATGYLDGGRMFNDTVIETVRRLPSGRVDLTGFGHGVREITGDHDRLQLVRDIIGDLKYLDSHERRMRADRMAVELGLTLPSDLMMSTTELRSLARSGMGVGGHTVTHPILARVARDVALQEMRDGKQDLERVLGQPVTLFAYPNGRPGKDYVDDHAALARECGFEAAVSTAWGAAGQYADLYQLPRFTPWDPSPFRFSLRMARNLVGRD